MKRKWIAAAVGLAATIAVSSAAFAQMEPPVPPGPPGPPPPIGAMLQGVSLTSEQQSAIDAILKSLQQNAQPLLDQLHTERQQLMTKLVSSGEVSLSDLTPLEQETAQTQQQLEQDALKAALQVRAVLTAEQLSTAAQNQQKLEQIHSEMRQLSGGMPPEAAGTM